MTFTPEDHIPAPIAPGDVCRCAECNTRFTAKPGVPRCPRGHYWVESMKDVEQFRPTR